MNQMSPNPAVVSYINLSSMQKWTWLSGIDKVAC